VQLKIIKKIKDNLQLFFVIRMVWCSMAFNSLFENGKTSPTAQTAKREGGAALFM
jgi:hypothetical protein